MTKKPNKEDWSKTFIIKNIVNGLMLTLPIIIVVFIILFLITFISKLISPVSKVIDPSSEGTALVLNLLAFLIILGIFFAIGIFSNTKHGKNLYSGIENKILDHIPMYSTVRNIVNSFQGVGERPFKRVVLIDAYGTGALMTGFVVERINEEMVVVYVPTAPNPTNGFVFHMKETELIETHVKTEAAMGTVIALGAGSKSLFDNKVYNETEGITTHSEEE